MIGCQRSVSPDFVWEMHANQGSGISFHFPFLSAGWEIKVWVIGPFFPAARCLCIPLCRGSRNVRCSLQVRERTYRLRLIVENVGSVDCLQVSGILWAELFHGGKIDILVRKLERQTTAAETGDWPTARKGSGVKVTGRDCESVSGCLRGGPWGGLRKTPDAWTPDSVCSFGFPVKHLRGIRVSILQPAVLLHPLPHCPGPPYGP